MMPLQVAARLPVIMIASAVGAAVFCADHAAATGTATADGSIQATLTIDDSRQPTPILSPGRLFGSFLGSRFCVWN